MGDIRFTCPRCFFTGTLPDAFKFCPRCGLPDARQTANDAAPMYIAVGAHTFMIHDRIAVGSICNLYRCRFDEAGEEVEGIFKITRDARGNGMVANEAAILRKLHGGDGAGKHTSFLPAVVDSFPVGEDITAPARQANVLRPDKEIHSPGELYSLAEVRTQYTNGLDPRDMAWIWRRLLTILDFVHAQGVVHGAVLPQHVMIEPREHKLVLIDWCCAQAGPTYQPLTIIDGGYLPWFERGSAVDRPPTPGLDLALAARCMIDLIGGDALAPSYPPGVDPALQQYFEHGLDAQATPAHSAWKLLTEFDRLVESLWGPMTPRTIAMPNRRT